MRNRVNWNKDIKISAQEILIKLGMTISNNLKNMNIYSNVNIILTINRIYSFSVTLFTRLFTLYLSAITLDWVS